MGFFGTIGRIAKGAAVGFVTGGPAGAVAGGAIGAVGGGGGGDRITNDPRIPGRGAPRMVTSSPCNPPLVRDANGMCVFPGSPADISVGGRVSTTTRIKDFGQAVMGQFGAALVPAVETGQRLVCPPGAVLGKDDLCYNRSDLSRRQRKWNPGRKPLLTGGERNAITKAAAAARKIQRTEKQLQKLGMLKKPTRARRAPAPRALPPGRSGQQFISVGE